MTMTTIILVILIGYVMPAVYMYFWNRSAHGEGGVHDECDAGFEDLLMTLMPVVNIIGLIICASLSINGKSDARRITANKFFGVKKNERWRK